MTIMSVNDVGLWSNLLATLLVVWIFVRTQRRLYKAVRHDQYRYRLFALRDRLTFLVMEGEIKEGSPEHIELLKLINESIFLAERFRVTEFIRALVEISKSQRLTESVEKILSVICNTGSKEYKSIVVELFDLLEEKFHKDTSIFLHTTKIFYVFGRIHAVSRKISTLKETKQTINKYKVEFMNACEPVS